MTKVILILVLSLHFLTAFNCNGSGNGKNEVKKTDSSGENSNRYFPLSEGNSWSYVNEAPREETELFEVKAKGFKKIESGVQLKVSCFPFLTKDSESRTIKVKSGGQIEISGYMGYEGVIIPAQDNFKDGFVWKFGELTGRLSNFNDTVRTEAGNFTDCFYVILTDGFTFSYEMWFKKDIGIAKWGANRTNPPVLKPIYYVLKEYKLK